MWRAGFCGARVYGNAALEWKRMAAYDDGVEGLVDYSEDGEDLTLIRWMLSLTPEERLMAMQDCANSIEAIREQNAGI